MWLYDGGNSQDCFPGGSVVKNPPELQETWAWSLGGADPPEKEMIAHSSVLARKSHGQRSLVGHSPWGCKKKRRAGHDLATKQQPLIVTPSACMSSRSLIVTTSACMSSRSRSWGHHPPCCCGSTLWFVWCENSVCAVGDPWLGLQLIRKQVILTLARLFLLPRELGLLTLCPQTPLEDAVLPNPECACLT